MFDYFFRILLEHQRAAEAFVRILRRGRALSDGLGEKFEGVDETKLYSPFDTKQLAAHLGEYKRIPGGHPGAWHTFSIQDEAWHAVADPLLPTRNMVEKLIKEARDLRYQRQEQRYVAGESEPEVMNELSKEVA